MGDDKEKDLIYLTPAELESTIAVAVLQSKYDGLKEDMETHIINYNGTLLKLFAKIDTWPMDMVKCKEDLYGEVKEGFVTKPELQLLEKDIFNKLDMIRGKATWTMATIIAIASIAQYVLIAWTLVK